jgi:hypothetical protein
LYLSAVAQSANAGRAFIGTVDIIKYCDPHALPRHVVDHQHTVWPKLPEQGSMSALGQKQTSRSLFNHLVGDGE